MKSNDNEKNIDNDNIDPQLIQSPFLKEVCHPLVLLITLDKNS